jgi:hypothetical protein
VSSKLFADHSPVMFALEFLSLAGLADLEARARTAVEAGDDWALDSLSAELEALIAGAANMRLRALLWAARESLDLHLMRDDVGSGPRAA